MNESRLVLVTRDTLTPLFTTGYFENLRARINML